MFLLIVLGVFLVVLWLEVIFDCCDFGLFLSAVFCTFAFASVFALWHDSCSSDRMREKYNTIVYVMESYDEKGVPYDIDLLDQIAEWNTEYKKYTGNGIYDLFGFYPESAIEGTSEIILEIQK